MSIAVGVMDILINPNGRGVFEIDNWKIPDNFDIRNLQTGLDIAILNLKTEIPFDQAVLPACLPEKLPKETSYVKCFATGWGAIDDSAEAYAEKLMQVEVRLIPDKDCDDSQESVVCATRIAKSLENGDVEEGDPTCSGDSGGPLVCQRSLDGRWELTGITSYGYGQKKKADQGRQVFDDSWFNGDGSGGASGDDYDSEQMKVWELINNILVGDGGVENSEKTESVESSSSRQKRQTEVSFAEYPCGADTPGMFTVTRAYKDFINDDELFAKSYEPLLFVQTNAIHSKMTKRKNSVKSSNSEAANIENTKSSFRNTETESTPSNSTISSQFPSLVASHGCWCANIFSPKKGPVGGQPVDDLDRICKSWWQCRRCTKIEENCDHRAETYEARVQSDTGLMIDCEADSQCGQLVCECDLQLEGNLNLFIQTKLEKSEVDGVEFAVMPDKMECPGHLPSGVGHERCCGESPNWMPYDHLGKSCLRNGDTWVVSNSRL